MSKLYNLEDPFDYLVDGLARNYHIWSYYLSNPVSTHEMPLRSKLSIIYLNALFEFCLEYQKHFIDKDIYCTNADIHVLFHQYYCDALYHYILNLLSLYTVDDCCFFAIYRNQMCHAALFGHLKPNLSIKVVRDNRINIIRLDSDDAWAGYNQAVDDLGHIDHFVYQKVWKRLFEDNRAFCVWHEFLAIAKADPCLRKTYKPWGLGHKILIDDPIVYRAKLDVNTVNLDLESLVEDFCPHRLLAYYEKEERMYHNRRGRSFYISKLHPEVI